MKDEIREAMDAGYAQGVEATEKRAIKRIEGLESENAILRSELKLRQDVVEAAKRWSDGTLKFEAATELIEAVARLRRAEDGEEK